MLKEELMPFRVNITQDVSMNDLVRVDQAGGSVVKTPHVGNIYPGNLAVGHLGIRLVLYDRTIGYRDVNFHPHGVIRGGEFERLADANLLTTHTRAISTSRMAPDWFAEGGSMLKGHMQSLQAAMPQVQAEVYSRYLADRAQKVVDILRTITEEDPAVWQRSVLSDGTVQSYTCEDWGTISRRGIYGLSSRNDGALVPNVANIILLSVLEAQERGLKEVYHLSGPDMVKYIKQLMPQLHKLYDAVRKKLHDWNLPVEMVFHLIPVADLRWGVPTSRRKELDELIDAYLAAERNGKLYGDRIKAAHNGARREVIAEIGRLRGEDNKRIHDALRECPDPFYCIERADYISQYDLLAHKEGFYVHPWVAEAPISDVAKMLKKFQKLRKRL